MPVVAGGQVPKQGAVIGGWVCLALGTTMMFLPLFISVRYLPPFLVSFVLYFSLFLASFVLGIIAIAQSRILHGITILLLSIVVPLVIGYGLPTYHKGQSSEPINKPSSVFIKGSLPIEGIRIGMSARDISNLFPSLDPSWLDNTYIDETGKKQLRGMNLVPRDVPRFSQDRIAMLSIEFSNFKVKAFKVEYDLPFYSDDKNIDGFQHFISQRHGISGKWSTQINKEDWYRELIIDDCNYKIILHNKEGRGSGGPVLRIDDRQG